MEVTNQEKRILYLLKNIGIDVDTAMGIMLLLNKDWKQKDWLAWLFNNPKANADEIIGKAMEYGNICVHCKNYFGPEKGFPKKCKAYPYGDGIPRTILNEVWDHHKACPGDGGIVFEPIEGYDDKGALEVK